VKFLFADSMDRVDPTYDFILDDRGRSNADGSLDQWPHQYYGECGQKCYDGLLVSYAIVFGKGKKYNDAQGQRFRAQGAPDFLKFKSHPIRAPIIGDCGAFAYVGEEVPPYQPEEMANFYADCKFTHGISVDHIIFSFTENNQVNASASDRKRYDITIRNARKFLKYAKSKKLPFTPIASIQGWNPDSMAVAAVTYERMGYDYVAIGGLVPLKVSQIHACISAVRKAVPRLKIHLLGVTKADHIHEFFQYKITTFDSTSPLIRAFKDNRHNYWADDGHYTAIRVPQIGENASMKRRILSGRINQAEAQADEKWALSRVRAIHALKTPPVSGEVEIALEDILRYHSYLDEECDSIRKIHSKKKHSVTITEPWQFAWDRVRVEEYRRTLTNRPWRSCDCRVCQEAGPEVVLFRGSNRNKRRGFHNLYWFYKRLQRLQGK